ncbi:MAG TPA: outer membrane beta-barrel protein [Dongiaceae bacterium]|nr:outer membrane beta-barrel protein [Dongiaceae bacterium]
MRRSFAALGVLAALALATPAMAGDTPHFKIFGGISYVSPLGEDDVTIGSITDSVQGSNETGYEFGFEWRFGKWFGLEASYVDVTQEFEFNNTTIESDMKPINVALNFHLIHSKFVDFYVAPVASFVEWGDFEIPGGGSESVDSETAYGVQVGLDISLGRNVAIIGGVRWLSLDITPDDPSVTDDQSVAVDPLFTRLGIAFRF